MMSTNTILSPTCSRSTINPTQDVMHGLCCATHAGDLARRGCHDVKLVDDEGKPASALHGMFSSVEEARMVFDNGAADPHAVISFRVLDVE